MSIGVLKILRDGQAWGQEAITIVNNALKYLRDADSDNAGVLEIATDAEAQAKTATNKALVPSNLAALGSTETFAGLVELATTAEATTGTDTARAVTPAGVKAVADTITSIGKHKIWVPALSMRSNASAPPAAADVSATDLQYRVWDFDQTTIEAVHFEISMPSSWNEGTVTFIPVWTAAAGTGDVAWTINAAARSNDDVIAGSYSGSVSSIDTLIATGDLHRGPESAALTIDGTPAANDTVFFRLIRAANAVSDTLNADARLIGIELFLTTAAAVDVA